MSEQQPELSLSEIRALAVKAARGAGLEWGLAEEAGYAAEWLSARGLPGGAWLSAALQGAGGTTAWPDGAAGAGLHCAVRTGATLVDHASIPGEGGLPGAFALPAVAGPGLLLPFLARLAELRGSCVRIAVDGCQVALGPDGAMAGNAAALTDGVAEVSVVIGAAPIRPADQSPTCPGARAPVPAAALAHLTDLARRTVVPASEKSRTDAGSTMGDND